MPWSVSSGEGGSVYPAYPDYATPIEIEIWFSDGEDDIQYRLLCHQYFVSQDKLAVIHFLGREENEFEEEFKSFLHEQY